MLCVCLFVRMKTKKLKTDLKGVITLPAKKKAKKTVKKTVKKTAKKGKK